MKKHLYTTLICLGLFTLANAQTASGKLKFEQGQRIDIVLDVKSNISQQAMGQSIDFSANATANHSYKATNVTDETITLNHQVDIITFYFDGWGQKINFNSGSEKDMKGMFGKPMKDILDKKFSIIIDSTGNTRMAIPEKVSLAATDSRMAVFASLLKDVTNLVQPPARGSASFFKILPTGETAIGTNWTESTEEENNKSEITYTLKAITDTTYVIDFTGTSFTATKAEVMGQETVTTMNNKHSGKIIADKTTGIIKEKTITTESTGSTDGPFGSLPVTSKTATIITVKPQ